LVLASLLGAAAGGSLSAVIPTNALQLAASVGFLVIGVRLIQRSSGEQGDETIAYVGAESGAAAKDPSAD
jgi:uncharacterized membrane protein YfcA